MKDLHSPSGEELLLDALRRNPLLALDFDGTLSPLVPLPSAAAMDPRVPPLLVPLMARMPVAIVSGRGIVDLAGRVPVKGLTLVGNHGNEWDLPTEETASGETLVISPAPFSKGPGATSAASSNTNRVSRRFTLPADLMREMTSWPM